MPLYKRKSFALVEKPNDLKPQELVFQVRFTKEVFRNYDEYLKRINLYRQRVWTCKTSGKCNLTYEEALISEKKASKRIQNIPSEYIAPALRNVQYSVLNLKDLVNSTIVKLQGSFSEGAELYGRKSGQLHRCRIIKVLEDANRTRYKIAWLSSDKEINGTALINADELTGKNLPFSKHVLKCFIKHSTYQSSPWVLHDNLAMKYGISTVPPSQLKHKIYRQNGNVICNRKRKKNADTENTQEPNENGVMENLGMQTSKRWMSGQTALGGAMALNLKLQSIKFPVDDLLVDPSEEDQILIKRPSPCRDFSVPMDCVGNLLMVWDFFSSFGRLLHLAPFSLEDFEKSVCYKDSTPMLIVESYSTLLRLLLKDNGKFSMTIEYKRRKSKITLITWTEYLCDFLATSCTADFTLHISTIKRGHYGLLDVHVKLDIFQELIAQALETDIMRDKLDEYVEEQQILAATWREEVLDEGRKKRDEKERRKPEPTADEVLFTGNNHVTTNGDIAENCKIEHGDSIYEKNVKKLKVEDNTSGKGSLSKREIHKLMKNEIKESIEMKSIEQRKEYLDREIDKRFIRITPLGEDRNYCRYWFFRRDGRIFVESSDFKQWGYYQSKEEFDALIGSLNSKGVREKALKEQLQKFYRKICSGLQKMSKKALQRVALEENAVVRRPIRVCAPPRENPALAFLKYVNKWKEI